MSELEKLEKGFLEALEILKDYLPQIVIVGGWCPCLYARHLWKKKIPNIPTTLDIDRGVLETGNRRFERTVFDQLKSAGLALERSYADEATPVEFIYKQKAVEIKIEFITSFETTDDTLNRFLGSQLACNRIEAFELLLKETLSIPIRTKGEKLSIRVPTPEIFLYHKGITFVMRSADFKRVFLRLLHPQVSPKEYLSGAASPGYPILRSFLRNRMEEAAINQDIRSTFSGLLEIL